MKVLSQKALKSAKVYLENHGRILALALYRFVFENGPKETVYNAFKTYQWDDGGFGYNLEPHHRTLLASCYATSVAFKWINLLVLPKTDVDVKRNPGFSKKNF